MNFDISVIAFMEHLIVLYICALGIVIMVVLSKFLLQDVILVLITTSTDNIFNFKLL